eukprot:4524784-Amphidinium_carterae.1
MLILPGLIDFIAYENNVTGGGGGGAGGPSAMNTSDYYCKYYYSYYWCHYGDDSGTHPPGGREPCKCTATLLCPCPRLPANTIGIAHRLKFQERLRASIMQI